VHLVVADDHEGFRKAMAEVLPTALWQGCYVHFLRNALDHLPRSADRASLQELRWLYDRRDATEARTDLQAWLARWQDKHSKLCAWVEANIEKPFAYDRLPPAQHKHLKSTNLLGRLNQEFKRRTHIVRIFTDEPCGLRLIRALERRELRPLPHTFPKYLFISPSPYPRTYATDRRPP
jgi:putative transposase